MHYTNLLFAGLATLSSTMTVTAQKTHVVSVGYNGTLVFSPNKISAEPGEAIQFQFVAGNHTVTQSTFDNPCQPIAMHSNVTGINSGFMPVAAGLAAASAKDGKSMNGTTSGHGGNVPVYTVMVKNKNPMWLYCAQGKHCQNGMVMVVNENPSSNATKSLQNYKALAAKATTIVPSGSGSDSGSGSGSGTGSGTGSGSTNGSTTTDPSSGTTPSNSTSPSGSSTAVPVTAGAGVLSAAGTTSMFALVAGGAVAFLFL
ncbi:hypothetical protein NEUTE1DRAFT_82983 [Neurospora tetrasperma FGSC 2508]|uniref:Cupredoxin n=1 Tax=Neurospora tetrasperma (strain FGSC 2508 / ATCC MYA-4615 / P0657) TaxID=510951 RepID=F8MR85_NEUT8|nr:uncharacterized protein NEUTE1DRAFT_82983 [Neurospora tetrasperma FGSC 2508]EGO56044.1 hypothetical protein NEUTE1DRAFT_82983 [Neurospora tetrasperma FGSC 2508]EGZ71107.1 Cupredoxin [Neurospora tetrasperma FGSC 2509]